MSINDDLGSSSARPTGSSTKARRVACPSCRTDIEWSTDNPFRPFCSRRCKLTDLGAWASGAYRLPVPVDESGADLDEPLDGHTDDHRDHKP